MTLSFPYSPEAFADILNLEEIVWDVARFDELSAVASGHDLQAEMAVPKWKGTGAMRDGLPRDIAKRIESRVRQLQGSQYAFMMYDPRSKYPARDPKGTTLGAANVQIAALGVNGKSISLKGLPNGYVLSEGDKGQISYGTTRNYFFEIGEQVAASAGGVTPVFDVFPHVPASIAINAVVNLRKPACKMKIVPGGFNPGRSRGQFTNGMSIEFMETI